MATRRAVGLEPSLIDNDLLTIQALDSADTRSVTTRVAGPTALVVAKLHKLHDRIVAGDENRIADKDAADVFRLMQTTDVSAFVAMNKILMANDVTRNVTDEAMTFMTELFGARALSGVRMAVSALTPAVPEERVVGVTAAFVSQTLAELRP